MSVVMQVSLAAPRYFSWGWVSVSLPNLIVIVALVVVFVLALVLPFPKGRNHGGDDS